MKCQILFSRKYKKNVKDLSSTESAHSGVSVNTVLIVLYCKVFKPCALIHALQRLGCSSVHVHQHHKQDETSRLRNIACINEIFWKTDTNLPSVQAFRTKQRSNHPSTSPRQSSIT